MGIGPTTVSTKGLARNFATAASAEELLMLQNLQKATPLAGLTRNSLHNKTHAYGRTYSSC